MRIAFITTEYVTEDIYYGGLANYLYRISQALLKLGHEPEIFVSARQNQNLVHEGVTIHRIRKEQRLFNILDRLTFRRLTRSVQWLGQSLTLNRAVIKVHRRHPFSAVQCASYMATGVFRNRFIPTLIRISSYEPLWRKEYREDQSKWDHHLSIMLDRLALKKAEALYGPSHLLAEIVEKDIGRHVDTIESPFLLDVGIVNDRVFRDLLQNKRYLLFFGAVGLLKGVAVIAEIIEELLNQHEDLFFVFIGKDKGYEGNSMMEHLWISAGQNRGRVLYLGVMKHEYLYPILQNAHAVILPSLIDNLPNTCLESMALGKIVIGTRGASFDQLIEDGISGFLAERNSSASLLEKIQDVMALDALQRKLIGDCAREGISRLNPEHIAEQLVAYIEQVELRERA